ncbi:MAG: nicotinate (nicotinamide) nucleotide adenylyltransferase [Clostridia bacterium]|nr:nicotinate (nicotinamide) nucleotide adenylyltransferase [Clostridia bacterium]
MKKLGVFGGSFDPCHIEHVRMARAALSELQLDKLIVVPTGIAPHKIGEGALDGNLRLEMLQKAFINDQRIEISDYEIKKAGVSYTHQTLDYLVKLYRPEQTYFLVGTDMLSDFPTWKDPKAILDMATLVLTPREGEHLDRAAAAYRAFFTKPFITLEHVGKNVSSTRIRALSALELPIGDMVTKEVEDYIVSKGLYQSKLSKFVVKNLPIKRLKHTYGVMVLAVTYAKRLKINAWEAFTAAMLHDLAKYLDPADYRFSLPKDVPQPVVHQFLGAYIAEKVLNVKNSDIINAIRYHTTGRADMSILEKVVFLADLLEEGRSFYGVDKLRQAVDKDFDSGFETCVFELYKFLQLSGQPVYYLTKECFDRYCK